ncbi:MAG: hypothetical protein HQL07_07560 [Nitrospirae bacterium]|nr:hypothetical protein [Magnetococcales bacterium]
MPKTRRKSVLSGLDEPRPALMNMVRKYGAGLLILLSLGILATQFFGGSSDVAHKQTFIPLEIPPPVQSVAETQPVNQNTPPIPDDQE